MLAVGRGYVSIQEKSSDRHTGKLFKGYPPPLDIEGFEGEKMVKCTLRR